jgi:hypothetical protein
MTNKQPEALRLAEHDERLSGIMRMEPTYAPELRRLHELNAELVEALKLAREQAVGWYDDSRGFDAKRPPAWLKPIDDTIAKATGEQQ